MTKVLVASRAALLNSGGQRCVSIFLSASIAGALCLGSVTLDTERALATRAPNELGRVMILEYHGIGIPEGRWTRSPARLRRDLEQLWETGYRPIALNALISGSIDLPRGASPVVLTFDDSSPGQFRYVKRDGRQEIDPDCAVGILEEFARLHDGARPTATFFVLPGADEPNRLFGQPELEARKLRYLVSRGFELGNHTLWHADLSKYPEAVVRSQLARAQRRIDQIVPGYRLRALALPMGNYPRQIDWAIRGSAEGVSYAHDAILMVGGGAAPSPFSARFDPYRLPRIQAVDSALDAWLSYFAQHPGQRFVSDGDPDTLTIPGGRREEVRVRPGRDLRIIELD
jgi:peptidoglycan/xylan/chitin deacetylase (PgdA/CDA1 family)